MSNVFQKLNPFTKQPKMTTAIQVTDDLIRYIGLGESKKGVHVYLFGEEFLSRGDVMNGKIARPDRVTQALSSIKKRYNLQDVHVVIPDEQSFVFHTTVTQAEDNEMQTIIEDHIISYLKLHAKLPVNDLLCEYEITSEVNGSYQLSVTVTPRSVVEAYLEVFEEANLDPVTFEVGSYAISQACVANDDQESCMLVDFGRTKTHVSITTGKTPVHSGTLDVGEQHLHPVIEDFLNSSPEEAERIKQRYGVMRSHKEPALLARLTHELSPIRDYIDRQYINWHTKEYPSQQERTPIQKLVLFGEGAHLPGLRDFLASSTSINSEYLDVWRHVDIPEDRAPELTFEDTLRYSSALGTALNAMHKSKK